MAQVFYSSVRSFCSSASRHNAIKTVTVIGGGLMGSGIAQVNIKMMPSYDGLASLCKELDMLDVGL